MNGRRRLYFSISVTRTPRVAKKLAYSRPMTPAPTTASDRGKSSMDRMSSLVNTRFPSKGMLGDMVAVVPTAITTFSALTSRWLLPLVLRRLSLRASMKEASAVISSTRFRVS